MKKLITLLLCAVMLFGTAPAPSVYASSLDMNSTGKITLKYADEGIGFADLELSVYRVANILPDGTFKLVAPFSYFPISVNNKKTQAEWKKTANTMASYITAASNVSGFTVKTDSTGTVVMDNIDIGLYIVLAAKAERDGMVYSFENYFVTLPVRENGRWNYDVRAVPKKDKYTGYLEYSVSKLWQDAENPAARPQEVVVDIYCDGELFETQILNAENDWTYYWTDTEGWGEWTVVEKNVPQNYTVTISKNENVFSLINKYEKPPYNPPENPQNPPADQVITPGKVPNTGDISNFGTYFVIMCVSGLVLIVMGIFKGRKRR